MGNAEQFAARPGIKSRNLECGHPSGTPQMLAKGLAAPKNIQRHREGEAGVDEVRLELFNAIRAAPVCAPGREGNRVGLVF